MGIIEEMHARESLLYISLKLFDGIQFRHRK